MPKFTIKAKSAPKQKQEKDRIDLLLEKLNKEVKGVGRIDRGRDISWLDPPRIRTGVLGLDVVTNGGLPRGGLVQFWGPYSSGKTTNTIKAMMAEQQGGRHTAFAAGEGFNKDWARSVGLWIPYSDKEYEKAEGDDALLESMKEYDAFGPDNNYGTVSVMQHVHGDGLLEMVYKATKANVFSIIGVDSLAVLKNTRQIEEMEIGDEEQGGGGQIQMFNRFCAKEFSALNTKYDDEGNPNMQGQHANKTCVICINQARTKMAGGGKRGGQVVFQPVGGEGLKHAWMCSVLFSRGEEIGEEQQIGERRVWTHWAIEVRAKCNKSKIGPEGRQASWVMYIEDNDEWRKGQVDTANEVRIMGVYYNVIEQEGSYYRFPGGKNALRVNGKDAADQALREDPDLLQRVYDEVIERCRH